MPELTAFGSVAIERAPRYARGINAVIADSTGVSEALAEARRRNRLRESFFAVAAIDDSRTVVARGAAANILLTERDFDTRYELLRQISVGRLVVDGSPIGARKAYDRSALAELGMFSCMGDALLVRSWTEYRRLKAELVQTPSRITCAFCSSAAVPDWTAPFGGDHIVIWAPDDVPSEVCILAFGFEDLHTPTYVVCRRPEDAADLALRATFVGVDEAAPLLERALAVVVADISDPAPAVALAKSGVPLAIPSTSGAHEYLDGAAIYSPWNSRSVRGATLVAASSRPPRMREHAPSAIDWARELAAARPRTNARQFLSIALSRIKSMLNGA